MIGQEQGFCLEAKKGDPLVILSNMTVYDRLPASHRQLLRESPRDLCLLCLTLEAGILFRRELPALAHGELNTLIQMFNRRARLQETVPPA